ncbi:MAG TPA: aminotransferase class I/II-fold pyridoxal phosphate-dependent enzyme [Solirubrobacteraceae bacterium]|nr:aminotransferase class I/II-fold pyridoxal phosphate-dependent enzyme [Solirubrobacteraceae bacterium]
MQPPEEMLLAPADRAQLRRRAAELAPLGALAGPAADDPQSRAVLDELAARLGDTYPYQDWHYAGQMLKPPHPVAWAAYALTMLLNPNNHALDGGPATARMEREAVALLARMLLGREEHLGHLTTGGTVANLEALFVAREERPGARVVSGAGAHYTHARMCALLGVEHRALAQDAAGRMDLDALEAELRRGGVGTVVATAGTTSLGALDPVGEIAGLCAEHGARLHVDAAYGGFFALLADGGDPSVARAPFAAIARADSVVIDPHKHGLQPYGCGCVVFADPAVGRHYVHDSPYTYFTSDALHLGEISLECSRAGAAAAALWATLRRFPLAREGLGTTLAAAREAALELAGRLRGAGHELVVEPELDILCPFPRRARASAVSEACEAAFERLAAQGIHVAKLRVETAWLRRSHPWLEDDAPTVTTLRHCLMKPGHADHCAELADAIGAALAQA